MKKMCGLAVMRFVATACAVLALVSTSRAQLVVGNNPASGAQIVLVDLTGRIPDRVLVDAAVLTTAGTACGACVRVDGLAADDANGVLYWATSVAPRTLFKATYTATGTLTPESVGVLSSTVTGLAWDAPNNRLIGQVGGTGLVAINPVTAAITPLWTAPANYVFPGIDIDPVTGDCSAALGGFLNTPSAVDEGLFKISAPFASPTLTRVAGYPLNSFLSFQGLAAGHGCAFLVGGAFPAFSDLTGQLNRTYNNVSGVYEASPSIGLPGIRAAGWAPGLMTVSTGSDLVVAGGASESCAVEVGEALTFSARVTNYGADVSGPITLTVTLPPSGVATFLDADPAPTTVTATELTFELPSLPGFGQLSSTTVKMRLLGVASGAMATVFISASSSVVDVDPSNNNTSVSTEIQTATPTSATISGVFSNKLDLANSLVPGGAGSRFYSFYHPTASPDGSKWVFVGENDFRVGAPRRQVLVRSNVGGSSETLLVHGVTPIPRGLVGLFEETPSVNNSGQVAFTDNDNGPTNSDQYVGLTGDGVSFVDVAREGDAIPGIPGATYGTSSAPAHVLNTGEVVFGFQIANGGRALFRNNGATVIAQEGVTVPQGASGPVANLPTDALGYINIGLSADGQQSAYVASISTEPAATDTVLVVNGKVAVQKGVTQIASGVPSSLSWITYEMHMGPTGMWMYPDRSSVRQDYIVRGYDTQILGTHRTGDPIHVGATESWSDLGGEGTAFNPADTFFTFQSDWHGHYVIGGYTDSADERTDSVLILDNLAVVARENDPVDLDGNGVFDDGMFIRSFIRTNANGNSYGPIAFTNDDAVLVSVTLRDTQAATCYLADNQKYWAIVRIPLPITGACCNGTACTFVLNEGDCTTGGGTYLGDRSGCVPTVTCNTPPVVNCCRGTTCIEAAAGSCTGTVAGSNSVTVAACTGNTAAGCCFGDYDHNGTKDITDIFTFLNAWFSSSVYADITSNGANTPDITDIFTFLNAWFGTCG